MPAWDAVRVPGYESPDQRGSWWCAVHAEKILTNLSEGPLAQRQHESWVEAVVVAHNVLNQRSEVRDALAEALGARDQALVEVGEQRTSDAEVYQEASSRWEAQMERALLLQRRDSEEVMAQ